MKYPDKWKDFFKQEEQKEYFNKLINFINNEYEKKTIYPTKENLFSVLNLIGPGNIKVVILGQDPYHEPNQAMGIAFSTLDDKTPRSLANMFKELDEDLNIKHYGNNDLSGWVKQGVLLLNTILSVEEHKPLSHANRGWETFTLDLLQYIYNLNSKILFVAFGNNAYEMYSRIKGIRYENVLKFGHPSPLSYYKYFKGTKLFSKINKKLEEMGLDPIDWSK